MIDRRSIRVYLKTPKIFLENLRKLPKSRARTEKGREQILIQRADTISYHPCVLTSTSEVEDLFVVKMMWSRRVNSLHYRLMITVTYAGRAMFTRFEINK